MLVNLDFDGTMKDVWVPYMDIHEKSVAEVNKYALSQGDSRSYVPLSLAELQESIRARPRERDRFIFERVGIAPAHLEVFMNAVKVNSCRLNDSDSLSPCFGVEEGLRMIKSAGYQISIVSNNDEHTINEFLFKTGIKPLIDNICGVPRGEVLSGEQHPVRKAKLLGDSIEAFYGRRQAPLYQTIMIGDSPIDVHAGKAYGILTIAVQSGVFSRKHLQEAHPNLILADIFSACKVICELGKANCA